ncbi:MAG TPA: hypothetical protein VGH27_15605 [Streptosporangiaceae bacterium]
MAITASEGAALPSSAEAAVGVLRQLDVKPGETLLLFGGGGGSVGVIATQLAVARGIKVISAVGEHDETLARELGATPVRYGAGLVITPCDPAAADFGVASSEPTPGRAPGALDETMSLLADGRLRRDREQHRQGDQIPPAGGQVFDQMAGELTAWDR